MVCATSKASDQPACAYTQSDQSLCLSLEYSLTVKLLTEHHLEFLSIKGGCTGSSESTLVKMPHCWKSHIMAQMSFNPLYTGGFFLLVSYNKLEMVLVFIYGCQVMNEKNSWV